MGTEGAIESWSLMDDSCCIITLQDTACTSGRGEEIWVLAHLPYPLAYVVENYDVQEIGSAEPSRQSFIRTSSLVDIHTSARNLVFVVPTQDRGSVRLAGRDFQIGRTDRHGNLDPAHPPTPVNFNEPITTLIHGVFGSPTSLREQFTEYTSSMFSEGLNWLEIDNLITLS